MKYHKGLTLKKWNSFSFLTRLANIGSEVMRSINWKNRNYDHALLSFYRSLELFNLTIKSNLTYPELKELCRLKEVYIDYFYCDNVYRSDDRFFNDYFTYITLRSKMITSNRQYFKYN